MNTRTDDTLIEEDEDEAKGQEYVAVEEDDKAGAKAEDENRDGEDDGEDARLDADNEDREDLRRRRREEKAERAQRRKAAMERDKAELEQLRRDNAMLAQRMQAIERRSATSDAHALQARLNEANEEVRAAEYVIAQAVSAGNGDDVAKAIRIRDEAVARARELTVAQMQMKQQRPQQQQQPEPQGLLDPVGHRLAQDWAKMNSWFDPNGKDERSREVMKIDQELINDGYNPNSLEYWHELTALTRNLAPGSRQQSKGGPRMGSGKERAASSSRNEVYISPERKAAMIESGAWDDPVRRQRMLKQYAEWDRNNK
jgi:hypothetical protein